MGQRRLPHGFTLIETLVALLILGVALLAGMTLVLQQPRVVRRIDAGRQAVHAMESTLESMRAGLVPIQSQELDGFANSAPDLKVAVTVIPEPAPGLYQVSLVASYSVFGQAKRREMQTLLWRRGG
jgi:prepilin-type N-terminal cleavage/methylation domain-containing protein